MGLAKADGRLGAVIDCTVPGGNTILFLNVGVVMTGVTVLEDSGGVLVLEMTTDGMLLLSNVASSGIFRNLCAGGGSMSIVEIDDTEADGDVAWVRWGRVHIATGQMCWSRCCLVHLMLGCSSKCCLVHSGHVCSEVCSFLQGAHVCASICCLAQGEHL